MCVGGIQPRRSDNHETHAAARHRVVDPLVEVIARLEGQDVDENSFPTDTANKRFGDAACLVGGIRAAITDEDAGRAGFADHGPVYTPAPQTGKASVPRTTILRYLRT